jgi:hypothetical protein
MVSASLIRLLNIGDPKFLPALRERCTNDAHIDRLLQEIRKNKIVAAADKDFVNVYDKNHNTSVHNTVVTAFICDVFSNVMDSDADYNPADYEQDVSTKEPTDSKESTDNPADYGQNVSTKEPTDSKKSTDSNSDSDDFHYDPADFEPPPTDHDPRIKDSIQYDEAAGAVSVYFGDTLPGVCTMMGTVINATGDGSCFFHAVRIALQKQGLDPMPDFAAWYEAMRDVWKDLCSGTGYFDMVPRFLPLKDHWETMGATQATGIVFENIFPPRDQSGNWVERNPIVLQMLSRFFGMLLAHESPGSIRFLDAATHRTDAALERTLVATAFLDDITRWFIVTSDTHFKAVGTKRRNQLRDDEKFIVMTTAAGVLARTFANAAHTRIPNFVPWIALMFPGRHRRDWENLRAMRAAQGGDIPPFATEEQIYDKLVEGLMEEEGERADLRTDAAHVYFAIKATGEMPPGYENLGPGAGAGAGAGANAGGAAGAFTDCAAAPIASRR